MNVIHDYVDENGTFRAAHNGERRHDSSVVLGVRDPSSPKYGSGSRRGPYPNRWAQVKDDPKIPTAPMDSPPTVN